MYVGDVGESGGGLAECLTQTICAHKNSQWVKRPQRESTGRWRVGDLNLYRCGMEFTVNLVEAEPRKIALNTGFRQLALVQQHTKWKRRRVSTIPRTLTKRRYRPILSKGFLKKKVMLMSLSRAETCTTPIRFDERDYGVASEGRRVSIGVCIRQGSAYLGCGVVRYQVHRWQVRGHG